ncbi:MAG: hypothetical protein WCE81_00265 [Halobacteriota archaeon]
MDTLTVFRVVLPAIGIVIFVLVATLTRAPRYVTFSALEVCWVAGLISLVADAVANVLHFWHYTLNPLYYGLPIDFYVTVSLVYGGAVSLIYWRISHSKYKTFALYFVIALPFYGLVRDFFAMRVSGSTFLVWDHPLWWIADFIAWAAGLWTTILVFHLKIRRAE